MMKFYTKPEIEALALEVVDVIETSAEAAKAELEAALNAAGKSDVNVQIINEQIADMSTDWQW